MDTKTIAKGAAAFALTLTGLLAGAVGFAAYAARRSASVDLGADGTASAGAASGSAEHGAADLATGELVTKFSRAPEAFRPDPTAVPTAEEREALRPATGPAPSLAADRGSFAQGLSRADG